MKINYKFINYLRTSDCADVMEANHISVHILSGNISVGDVDTSESIYNFLENQVDESKKLVSSVLRFEGTIGEFADDFLESFDSEEQ